MADEIPTFESMFRKSKGLDLAEEAPSEEEDTPSEKQRSRVYDKLTDEDGNSRLKHKANVPALENYDQDIRAPQGEVHDADKLKATRKSAGIREMVARKCFEKTGRIPDVEFMDTYEVKKAADEADFNEMAEGFADSNRKNEFMEEAKVKYPHNPDAQATYADSLAQYGEIPTEADDRARLKNAKLMDKPYRKELSDTAQMMAPRIANNPFTADMAGEHAKDIAGYRTGDYGGRNFEYMLGSDKELERRLKEGLVNILSKNYNMDKSTAQLAADEYIMGFMYGDAGPVPPDYYETGFEGESDEHYAKRMQDTLKRLKSDKIKKAAIDAESDTPIEDREARRLIGKTAPQLVERVSSWNEGAPLTDTDGQELGQMTGASSTRYAYNTNDFTMEDAALKNENALEKALRGYLDSNPNISIEDLEKFIESSKGGFRIGVETPFL